MIIINFISVLGSNLGLTCTKQALNHTSSLKVVILLIILASTPGFWLAGQRCWGNSLIRTMDVWSVERASPQHCTAVYASFLLNFTLIFQSAFSRALSLRSFPGLWDRILRVRFEWLHVPFTLSSATQIYSSAFMLSSCPRPFWGGPFSFPFSLLPDWG